MAVNKYNKTTLKKFRVLLMDERNRIAEDLEYQKGELNKTITEGAGELSSATYHMADVGTDMAEREKTSLFAHRQAKYLSDVDEALDRVEEETYGVCIICGDLIEEGRLMAAPIAKYHVSCKETQNQRNHNQ
ncbi:MAG: TraR/DksA C4-type zinc finger protein [FCB group bacterium]|nr:TraR/DksA C4-type zinc finger protein [FCB group bacterium]MBL7028074.1 TraR/DksA C4-type zinc finger protein [Candidatus Neomarinimicrobiota bacterium]MBL7122812.1 TraR/DksA C4-type zinc finger protein [Candidatus Neomarinimicrobiota bacterium]